MSNETLSALASIATIIGGLGTAVLTIVAWQSLTTWRAELKYKEKFDLARSIIRAANQFRDEFHAARGIVMYPGELTGRTKGDNETPGQSRILDQYQAHLNRLERLRPTIAKLRETTWEAEIVLGRDIAPYVAPLAELFAALYISVRQYFDLALEDERTNGAALRNAGDMRFGLFEKNERMITGTSEDEIGKSANDAAQGLIAAVTGMVK